MIYILNFFIISVFSVVNFSKENKRYGKIILLGISLFLIIFASLRDNVGLDDQGYKEYFNATNSIEKVILQGESLATDRTQLVEPLFLLISSVGKLFVDHVFILFFITASIAIFIRYKIFLKYSPYPILSLLIYASHEYYVKDWTQIRAGLASAIILYAIQFLISGRNKKFIFTIIIAAGFHFIALLGLPLLYFNRFKKSRRSYYLILGLCVGISILIPFKATLIQLSEYGILPYRVAQYLYYDKYAFEIPITNIIIVKGIVLSYLSIYFLRTMENKYAFYKAILHYQLLSTIYLLLFRDFSIMAVRANGLLYAVEPILIVLLLNQIKQKKVALFIGVFYSFLWVFYDQYFNPFGLPPYKTILE